MDLFILDLGIALAAMTLLMAHLYIFGVCANMCQSPKVRLYKVLNTFGLVIAFAEVMYFWS